MTNERHRYGPNVPHLQRVAQGQAANRNAVSRIVRGNGRIQPGNTLAHRVRAGKVDESVDDLKSLTFTYQAHDDPWTERTAVQHRDDDNPSYSSVSTQYLVPIGTRPAGRGFEWNKTIFAAFDFGPVKQITGTLPDLELVQTTTTRIELLALDGTVLKWAECVTRFDYNRTGSDFDNTKGQDEIEYDANGPADEFYKIKVTFSFADTPIWDSALNQNTVTFSWAKAETPYDYLGLRTRHGFSGHELINDSETGVAWWRAADHTRPFPWKMNRATPRCVTQRLASFEEAFALGDTVVPYELQLWCTDAAGAELAQLPVPFGDAVADAYGLKWKLIAGDQAATIDVGAPCVLFWNFVDERNRPIAPPKF